MTPARRSLLDVLQRTSAREVAARCRCSAAAVSQWASGKRAPSKALQKQLFAHYGVTASGWKEGPKARRVIR